MTDKKKKGLAGVSPEIRKEICRKGGLTISRDREHMKAIGRKGGLSASANRAHMAEIGRKGGKR